MKSCQDSNGKLMCNKCKYNHCYYGCLAQLFNANGFVQIATKTSKNFVQIDNKSTLDK